MVRPARQRADNVATKPAFESASRTPSRLRVEAVTDGDIDRRAFELYCERGCQDGHDADDWLKAERELRGTVSSTVRVRGSWAQRLP